MNLNTFKIWGLFLVMCCATLQAQIISESFELRYFSNDEKANGETDFKGETAVFDTETRVEFLKHYANYAKHFFNDPQLDKLVVTDQEVDSVFRKIKPQPQPEVRKRVRLNQWKWTAWRPGLIDDERRNMQSWISVASADIRDGTLIFKGDTRFTKEITEQDWRFFIEWKMKFSEAQNASFLLLDKAKKPVIRVGLNESQQFFYQTKTEKVESGRYDSGEWITCKIEVDLENGKYNFYVNDQLQADFVDLVQMAAVRYFRIESGKSLALDDVYGVGYQKSNITDNIHWRDVPFTINTFIDEDFELHPEIENWTSHSYDDARWETTDLPKAHGGERYAGETLYLRKWVAVDDFERAVLNIETLDPGGEIWINDSVVHVTQNRHPVSLDISKYLTPNARNLICLKVFPNKVEHTNRHTSADEHTGWFAGRAYLDYTSKRYIDDVFVYTKQIGEKAQLNCEIRLKNIDWQIKEREIKKTREFHGQVTIKAFKWFPDELNTPQVEQSYPVYLRLFRDVTIEKEITVPQPELWTPEQPNLYRIVVELADTSGRKIDDYVLTTGIRTISQEGGTFRLNGEPSMMNGALLFSYKSPLKDIARLIRCSPDNWIAKELLMIKKMNANTIRMSVHHGMKGGINDPRYAEIGDQLGVMFQWTTGTWVRTGSPWLIDFEGSPKYIKQVRNHPSIVMWQPANHPKFVDFDEAMDWFEKIYDSIYPLDPSRLISPTANISRMDPRNDDGTLDSEGNKVEPVPIWTAPMITRGSMEHGTGYGAEWSTLRLFPSPPEWAGEDGWRERGFRLDYLNSDERAWFDFESEESIGQPNWSLRKGKPSYQFKSYELGYDKGSIGRMLTVDEWQESQAWQAFSGYEAYKKKRWLDYDGLAWCCLRGGGNTSTYQKPLIDYYDHAKLSYYALKMVFQKTLAGSGNVDVVYGPDDTIEPVIMHIGDVQKVDLSITLLNLNRNEIDRVIIEDIELEPGRSVKELDSIQFQNAVEGFYVIRYDISAAD